MARIVPYRHREPVYLGTTVKFTYTVRDNNGEPVDLSGATHRALLKRSADDDDSDGIPFEIDTSQAAAGTFTISLSPDQTRDLSPGTYVADHRVKTADDDEYIVAAFVLPFQRSVTHSVE